MPQHEKIEAASKQNAATGEAMQSTWMQLPDFEATFLTSCALPPALRALAENGVMRGKEAWETLGAAAEETYSASARGLDECGIKIMEAGRNNVDAAFDCCRELVAAKTQSELIEVWSTHARRQLDAMIAQNKEILSLAWKVAAVAPQPIVTGITQTLARSG